MKYLNSISIPCIFPNGVDIVPARISIQFLFLFYAIFILNPISIVTSKLVYFAYILITIYGLCYLISVRFKAFLKIITNSRIILMLFLIINLSFLWSINVNKTLFNIAIFNAMPIFYLAFGFTILFSTPLRRSNIYIFITFTCFLINLILLLNFGVVRAHHHAMKDIVNSYANNMVVMMEASLPILFYRIKYKSSKFVFAAFFMSLFNIIVSESRGGLVTLSLFFLLLPLYYYRRKFNKVLLLSIIVFSILFVIGGILFSNAFENFEVLQRFSEIKSIGNLANSRDTSELSARLMMYYHGFVLILSNPILGIGWGSFISSMEDFYGYGVIAHNLIIEIWTSCGIIGVIIFTLTFFTAFKRLYKHYRFNLLIDTNISYWCMANIVCLILLCFHGLFRPFLTNILLYLPLAEAFIFTRYKSVQQTT